LVERLNYFSRRDPHDHVGGAILTLMHILIEAVMQNSEAPLRDLPDEWRDKAIAGFRQFIKK
jgi:hypothetical protein